MMQKDYIECAGVRVPADWNLEQLRAALLKRKIRFQNEAEIMSVFGEAIELKAKLEKAIDELENKKKQLQDFIHAAQGRLFCPHCQKQIFEPVETK